MLFFRKKPPAPPPVTVEALYEKYYRLLYKIAYDILGDATLSEDALHETFVRVMKNLHKIDAIESTQTKNFLAIICRHISYDMYKKQYNTDFDNTPIEEAPSQGYASDPQEIVLNAEALQIATEAIKALKPIYRDVLLLCINHDMSYAEIAQALQISEETVRKRLYRARQILKEQIRKEDATHE